MDVVVSPSASSQASSRCRSDRGGRAHRHASFSEDSSEQENDHTNTPLARARLVSNMGRGKIDSKEIFKALEPDEDGKVDSVKLLEFLKKSGLATSDGRMRNTYKELKSQDFVDFERFQTLKTSNELVGKAFRGELAISDFEAFCDVINDAYKDLEDCTEGENADYIPTLATVNPDYWAISVCSVHAQRYSIGDSKVPFCLQSTCKPLNYCMAVELHGKEKVHEHVGHEPSGRNFNERVLLQPKGIPHNPLINAGAIMVSSLLYMDKSEWERYEAVTETWQHLAGMSRRPHIQYDTFMGERATANRNYCLAYMMAEENAFPPNTDIQKTLESYFQWCSLELDCEEMSVVAATLANGGICPKTGERVFSQDTVSSCLSMMMSCGMYDYSGEFAFTCGFPAKSGVSGVLCIVIPGVCGIATFSPRLDALGNSVRGVKFCQMLSKRLPVHAFGGILTISCSVDVLTNFTLTEYSSLWWSAAVGDAIRIRHLAARGIDVRTADYDLRTALHLAVCNHHRETVKLLMFLGADPEFRDRYNNTSVMDAQRESEDRCVRELKRDIALRASCPPMLPGEDGDIVLARYFADMPWPLDSRRLIRALEWYGLPRDSPRVQALLKVLNGLYLVQDLGWYGSVGVGGMPDSLSVPGCLSVPEDMNLTGEAEALYSADEFSRIAKKHDIAVKALCGKLIVPNWPKFTQRLNECFSACCEDHPHQEIITVGVCTTDSQQYARDESALPGSPSAASCVSEYSPVWTPEECLKCFPTGGLIRPILYCMAVEMLGLEEVHKWMGREPSGEKQTYLGLDHLNRPHNPFVMMGTINLCALLSRGLDKEYSGTGMRPSLERVLENWRKLSGSDTVPPEAAELGKKLDRRHSDLARSMAYRLRSIHRFPNGADIDDAIQLMFETHEREVNVAGVAAVAASFANSGVCPKTNERVFKDQTIRYALSLMYSCGMDQRSGMWAYNLGIPGKNSNLGAGMAVVPGVLGICVHCPSAEFGEESAEKTIRNYGTSEESYSLSRKGLDFFYHMEETFNFHLFKRHDPVLRGSDRHVDPTLYYGSVKHELTNQLIMACANKDVYTVQYLLQLGVDPNVADYDSRTAVHLAAASGCLSAMKLLMDAGARLNTYDRWGNTPYEEAKRHGRKNIVKFLEKLVMEGSPSMREERKTKSLDSDAAEDDFVNDAEAVMEYFGDVEVLGVEGEPLWYDDKDPKEWNTGMPAEVEVLGIDDAPGSGGHQ
ncbi:glutaminase, putative [Perkinsus marinus ATCC 50983]|uniref:glutaminase n=1 Tax=Perkinsus marinus (strain ATCC 50983 / TXsc) TaxID=423536 RepID=C5LIJ3_PERM5|nr:glutaminase, putative [Perkinsus marinus ATCC 50983]EER03396.1 glutaminase, putative [Perkinsus marinus ATCC 50983]|eukprot:XP_002771580.1 glutaminase, putative [Perkinsus marinus ATCC 50983]